MDGETKLQLLETLRESYSSCMRCPDLAQPRGRRRYNTVFGEGNPNAKLLIVVESPGQRDDETGRPLQGKRGELLDRFLDAFRSSRDEVFITHTVMCRATHEDGPLRAREPSKQEITACQARLHETIRIVDPYVILLMGKLPLKALTKSKKGITTIARSKLIPRLTTEVQGISIPVEHSAYATFSLLHLIQNGEMEEGGDMHMAWLTWRAAFELHDSFKLLYEGEPIPDREEEAHGT